MEKDKLQRNSETKKKKKEQTLRESETAWGSKQLCRRWSDQRACFAPLLPLSVLSSLADDGSAAPASPGRARSPFTLIRHLKIFYQYEPPERDQASRSSVPVQQSNLRGNLPLFRAAQPCVPMETHTLPRARVCQGRNKVERVGIPRHRPRDRNMYVAFVRNLCTLHTKRLSEIARKRAFVLVLY